MSLPKLTIIIPTICRPDTLFWTLQTVLNQEYENYKVIVSDNFSNDNTKEIVDSFRSDKIIYVNPGKRLSMSRHWEFALDQVQEGYVTILGDDDGLLPGSLVRTGEILRRHPVQALGWRFCNFTWKGVPPHFMIPMANYYRIVNAGEEIKRIFRQNMYSTIRFPSLYGGFVDIRLIKRLKEKYGGTFFHSRIPDFFSGAMIAASVQKYIRLEFPVSINATSRHSTGFAATSNPFGQNLFTDMREGNDNIPFDEKLVFISSLVVPIAEAMIRVHELVPSFPEIRIEKLLREIAAEAASTNDRKKFDELKNGIAQIAILNGMEAYGKQLSEEISFNPSETKVKRKFSLLSITLYIDTRNKELNNVKEACDFAGKVIAKRYYRLTYGIFMPWFRINALVRWLFLKTISSQRHNL